MLYVVEFFTSDETEIKVTLLLTKPQLAYPDNSLYRPIKLHAI